MRPHRILLIVLAGALVPALAPADAGAQRRGDPVHGGDARSVEVVRPAPYSYRGYYDLFFWGYPGWYPYGFYAPAPPAGFYGRPTVSDSIAVQLGGR